MSITFASTESVDNRLTTVRNVTQTLDISSTGNIDYINRLIKAASFSIENYTEREFQYRTLTETLQAQNQRSLLLTRRPLRSVTQIKLDGSTISTTTYEIDNKEASILFRTSGVWTSTLLARSFIERMSYGVGLRDWSVQYVAGYILPNSTAYPGSTAALPDNIEEACVQTVKSWFLDRKNNPALKSEKIGDASETHFDTNFGLPPISISLLKRYRVFDPL